METPSTITEYDEYAAPQEYLEPVGPGRRFANYMVDVAAILTFGIIVVFICALLGFDEFIDSLDGPLMSRLVGLVLSVTYYLVMEGLFARTLGKVVTDTKVVMEDGSRPPFAAILKRTLWRCVPFDALTFLGHGRGWHDTKTDTLVVRRRPVVAG